MKQFHMQISSLFIKINAMKTRWKQFTGSRVPEDTHKKAEKLDSVPTKLKIHPWAQGSEGTDFDVLQEDLLTVQSLCLNRINMVKRHTEIIKKLLTS